MDGCVFSGGIVVTDAVGRMTGGAGTAAAVLENPVPAIETAVIGSVVLVGVFHFVFAVAHAVIGVIISTVTVTATDRGTMIHPTEIVTELNLAVAMLGGPIISPTAVPEGVTGLTGVSGAAMISRQFRVTAVTRRNPGDPAVGKITVTVAAFGPVVVGGGAAPLARPGTAVTGSPEVADRRTGTGGTVSPAQRRRIIIQAAILGTVVGTVRLPDAVDMGRLRIDHRVAITTAGDGFMFHSRDGRGDIMHVVVRQVVVAAGSGVVTGNVGTGVAIGATGLR